MTLRDDGSYLHRIGYIHEDICSQVTTVIKRVLTIKCMLNETRRKQTEIPRRSFVVQYECYLRSLNLYVNSLNQFLCRYAQGMRVTEFPVVREH